MYILTHFLAVVDVGFDMTEVAVGEGTSGMINVVLAGGVTLERDVEVTVTSMDSGTAGEGVRHECVWSIVHTHSFSLSGWY